MTKKASTQDARRKEMRKIKKLIQERNDSSIRVSSKLSLLQIFSAVISLLVGEAGRFADRWFHPEYDYSSQRQPSLLYRGNFSAAPLETRSGVDIRAQLKTGSLVMGVQYRFCPVSYHNINTF